MGLSLLLPISLVEMTMIATQCHNSISEHGRPIRSRRNTHHLQIHHLEPSAVSEQARNLISFEQDTSTIIIEPAAATLKYTYAIIIIDKLPIYSSSIYI